MGQIYLYANPLLHEPLEIEHIKPRLLGHWGTTPGLNFIYVHFNQLIKKHDLNVIYVTWPGHGGPRFGCQHLPVGHLQRTVSQISQTQEGLRKLFKQFSFPEGIPSHVAQDGHPRAKLAFEIFVHRLQAGIGAMIAVLGGIDALVFTAGIGENSPEVRAAACANFTFLGLKLDSAKNEQSSADQDISIPDSAVRVLIVCAQEEWAIARDCWGLISARSRGRASAN